MREELFDRQLRRARLVSALAGRPCRQHHDDHEREQHEEAQEHFHAATVRRGCDSHAGPVRCEVLEQEGVEGSGATSGSSGSHPRAPRTGRAGDRGGRALGGLSAEHQTSPSTTRTGSAP